MRRAGYIVLAIIFAACAHEPEPAPSAPSVSEGLGQIEIRTLQQRIADRKVALHAPAHPGESTLFPTTRGGGARCDGVCQAAQEICTWHRRICRLARDINDDKSAQSCHHARRDCEEAGQTCAACR